MCQCTYEHIIHQLILRSANLCEFNRQRSSRVRNLNPTYPISNIITFLPSVIQSIHDEKSTPYSSISSTVLFILSFSTYTTHLPPNQSGKNIFLLCMLIYNSPVSIRCLKHIPQRLSYIHRMSDSLVSFHILYVSST